MATRDGDTDDISLDSPFASKLGKGMYQRMISEELSRDSLSYTRTDPQGEVRAKGKSQEQGTSECVALPTTTSTSKYVYAVSSELVM